LIKRDGKKGSKKELRGMIVNNDNYKERDAWVLEVPYEVRDAAMVDLLNALSTNLAKKRKNKEHKFNLQYRSRKASQETIMIRGKCFKNGVFYPKFFGKGCLRSSETLPQTVDYDCKLTHTRLGHYYLSIPQPLVMASDIQARQPARVVALDPGVRTFHTAYDPSGSVMEFGKGDIGHIYRLCTHMDDLHSKIDSNPKMGHKRRYRMRRAWRKMQWRIHNLIDECHKKVVRFLCTNYSVILLPSFETQQMVIRKKRKLRSKTARAMITWSHYRFKQRLLFKRQEYPWCKVIICNESYTSKTCGNCGHINHKLGGNKIFKCSSCGLTIDRDVHAARNILLKNASLFGFEAREALGLTPVNSSVY
jgi:putative transposase